MSKQLILITAPFNCGYCKTAQKELPTLCEENGYELIEMENEQDDDSLPVDLYPTIMVRVNDKMEKVINGYNKENIIKELKKY